MKSTLVCCCLISLNNLIFEVGKIVNSTHNTVTFAIISMNERYHSNIVAKFQSRLTRDEELEVFGGGILTIDKIKKTIFTYGQSGGYGPPDVTLVKEILEKSPEVQGYSLNITVTKYIRD